MAIYALADTHLSLSVDKPMDVFGSRWSGYMKKLDNGWHDTVTDDDTVVIPGDISWAMNLDQVKNDLWYIDDLPGKKIISRGNHDYWWETTKKLKNFFAENDIKTISLLHNNAYIIEDMLIVGTRGWYSDSKNSPADTDYTKIVMREAGRLSLSIEAGKKLLEVLPKTTADYVIKSAFLHFPPVYRDYICNEIVEVLQRNKIDRCYFGHIHGTYDIPPVRVFGGIEYIPVAADYLNFIPLRIN